MSLIKPLTVSGGGLVPTSPVKAAVFAGAAASVKAGYLLVEDPTGGSEGTVMAAANGTTTSSTIFGIAAGDSTETATANGEVEYVRAPVLICKMKATTPANLATAVLLTQCTLDVSSGSYTVDENDTTNGFIKILWYDNTTDGNCIVEIPCGQ